MRILPQSSARNENNAKIFGKHTPDKLNKKSFYKKILLFTALGLVLIAIVVSLAIVLTRKKESYNDSEGYLVNNGYFYPIDDKYTLYKCTLKNCQKCSGTLNDNKCYQCFSNSTPEYESYEIVECKPKESQEKQSTEIPNTIQTTEKTIIPYETDSPTQKEKPIIPSETNSPTQTEKLCITGLNENCLECGESENICLKCNPGYFLPSDDTTKLNCQKCPIKNCKVCSGTSGNPTCLICENYAVQSETDPNLCQVKKGEEAFCKTDDMEKNECSSCNIGYLLEDGKCILNYDIKAIFKTRTNNEEVKLIQKFYPYVEEMIVNGNKLDKIVSTFIFENKGEHTVYYKLNLPKDGSLVSLFEGIDKMVSISFSEKFAITSVKKMNRMFYNCESLKRVDLSNINTKNVDDMNYMFHQCLELDSIDLSKVESSNVNDISNIFENCISLKNIDISNFTNSNIKTADMLKNIPETGSIIVNKKFKSKIESKLNNWNIIVK